MLISSQESSVTTLYQLVESKAEALYGGELELWLFAIFSRWEGLVHVLLEEGGKSRQSLGIETLGHWL